jgi:hypothetical protein
MKKYFINDGTQQQGPFSLEELIAMKITPNTPVWHEGMDQWKTAGQLEELNVLFSQQPPAFMSTPPVEEKKAETPVTTPTPVTPVVEEKKVETPAPTPVTVTPAAATTPDVKATTPNTSKPIVPTSKKSTAWISYVIALLVLGAGGYYIFQDMQKNKESKTAGVQMTLNDSTGSASGNVQANSTVNDQQSNTIGDTMVSTGKAADTMAANDNMNNNNVANNNTVPVDQTGSLTTPGNGKTTTAANNDDEKKKLAAAQAKKLADDKKKQQAIADAKKKLEDQKRLAAQAQAEKEAREAAMRNNWPRYVNIGSVTYNNDDGIKSFPVPVINGMTSALDKVTLRVDYIKKEGKIVGTENLVLYNVPSKSGATATAQGNKKARKANIYITGITSHGLHFCYPVNNGNAADPYYCN